MASAIAERTCVLRPDALSIRTAVQRIYGDSVFEPEGATRLLADDRRCSPRTILKRQRVGLFTPAVVRQIRVMQDNSARPTLITTLDVSPEGVGLTHDEPLAPCGVIWFNGSNDGPAWLVVEQRWTRQQPDGSYASGFKILGVVD